MRDNCDGQVEDESNNVLDFVAATPSSGVEKQWHQTQATHEQESRNDRNSKRKVDLGDDSDSSKGKQEEYLHVEAQSLKWSGEGFAVEERDDSVVAFEDLHESDLFSGQSLCWVEGALSACF